MLDVAAGSTPELDTSGRAIQAHGGGILVNDRTVYWFGEDKDSPTRPSPVCEFRTDALGFRCYSSTDWFEWTDRGRVFDIAGLPPEAGLDRDDVAERPKVVRNRDGRYVLWFHVDDARYARAEAGVAIADSPTGPYRYLGSVRPDGRESRDLTVFVDADDRGYLIFSSDGNANLRIAPLSHDLTSVAGVSSLLLEGTFREAPAVWSHDGRYYLLTSGCTGWDPNEPDLAVADRVAGPWRSLGNPLRGPGAELGFEAQGTFVSAVPSADGVRHLYLADRWVPHDLRSSGYLWRWIDYDQAGPVIRAD